MRIISGTYKGRRIQAPKKLPARPTTDMAKEALFNILNNNYYLSEISVLDLFAGTGNISYEFASRGTSRITAVDLDSKSVAFISKISNELNMPIAVFKSDVYKFLDKTSARYDIIFADPPYDIPIEEFEKIAAIVFKRELLEEDGILIIEHGKHTDLSTLDEFDESRKYGSSVFSYFKG